MRNSHPIITYAYHFLSESIIIFLIALPIMHHRLHWVPYWSYLAIIIGTCIVFSIVTRFTANYFWYLLMAPVLFGMFYLFHYPLESAIVFSVLLVWRYIDIRKEEIISRENTYILLTLILTAVNSVLVSDARMMIYPFIQFVILVIGYISSHLAVVEKEERKQFDSKLSLYFVGLLAVSAGLLFVLYDYARYFVLQIWGGILALFTGALGALSKILGLFDIEKKGWDDQPVEGGSADGDGYWNELQEFNFIEAITWVVVICAVVFFAGIALFYLWILFRKRFRGEITQEELSEAVSYTSINDNKEPVNWSIKNNIKSLFKKPNHPIRKLVYQLEQKAAKTKKGRLEYETVEDWLARIGLDANLETYQKVRYGNEDVSEQEIVDLKEQLKEIELNLEK